MYYPKKNEFIKLAKKGSLIPVFREIIADTETPVSAYSKIAGTNSFLLESVEGGEKWARYCFLGCDPSTVIVIKSNSVTIKSCGAEKTESAEDPLLFMKKYLSRYRPVVADDLPRFTGGAVGFFSYDMVR